MSNTLVPPQTSAGPLPQSPYKGLVPYSEDDAPFFFGREAEREIIISNLMSWRLTLLYGESGVGKSSVLRASVANHLRKEAEEDLAEQGFPRYAVVVFSTWRDDPIAELTKQVEAAVSRAWGGRSFPPLPPTRNLSRVLQAWTQRLEGELLIILDQFEEYFLYHGQEDGEGTFAYEFPQAVNQPNLRVSFLISIREDALAKLDRFKGRISELFDNYLRIEHLTPEAGRDAIERPLLEYNRRLRQAGSTEPPVKIEPQLVEAILNQTKTGQVVLGEAGRGGLAGSSSSGANDQIETPFLQLVMTRLWDEERRAAKSPLLRLETLQRLGGAEQIVRTHLDAVMSSLPPDEQQVASEIFRYLVTPSGTKIAYSVPDLAEYARIEPARLTPVMEKLSGSGIRILRPVAPPLEHPNSPVRYEIFHDVLASAILDWRRRYLQAIEKAKAEARLAQERAEIESRLEKARAETEAKLEKARIRLKRLRWILLPLGLIALGFVIFLGFLYFSEQQSNENYYKICEAVLSSEIPPNSVIMLNELGVPSSVMDRLEKEGVDGSRIIKVDESEFNARKRTELTNSLKRPVIGVRLQMTISSNAKYAITAITRIEANNSVSTRTVRTNYDEKTDVWKAER